MTPPLAAAHTRGWASMFEEYGDGHREPGLGGPSSATGPGTSHRPWTAGRGLNNDEIGAELFLSPATARTHVSHAMGKLGARDRAQLVVIAYETGVVGR